MTLRLALSMILAFALTLPAQAEDDAEQKYLNYEIALAIDRKCHFLRQFELDQTYPVSESLLANLSWASAYESGKVSEDEYIQQLDAVRARAASVAEEISCANQQVASSYILPLRADFADFIYNDLLIAFELGDLSPEQQEAARRYEAMVAPLYGANWPQFVLRAQTKAQLAIEDAERQDAEDEIYGFSLYQLSDDDAEYLDDQNWNYNFQVAMSVDTVNDILFEVAAESHGYRFLESRNPGQAGYIHQLTDSTFAPKADLIMRAQPFTTLEGGQFYGLLAVKSDGSVRLMTYGNGAHEINDGSAVFMVQTQAFSDSRATYPGFVESQDWWDTAKEFRGEKVDETCLGGPCFAFPADMVDALQIGERPHNFRYYFSQTPNVNAPEIDHNAIAIGYSDQTRARATYLAGQ